MASKKKMAAETQADMQEGKDVQEPQTVAEPDDTPALAADAAVDEVMEDAPRIDIAALDVQPLAPEDEEIDEPQLFTGYVDLGREGLYGEGLEPPVFDFTWAAQQIQNGLRVKRQGWTGNKFIDVNHPAGKHVITSEDMLATDWIVI